MSTRNPTRACAASTLHKGLDAVGVGGVEALMKHTTRNSSSAYRHISSDLLGPALLHLLLLSTNSIINFPLMLMQDLVIGEDTIMEDVFTKHVDARDPVMEDSLMVDLVLEEQPVGRQPLQDRARSNASLTDRIRAGLKRLSDPDTSIVTLTNEGIFRQLTFQLKHTGQYDKESIQDEILVLVDDMIKYEQQEISATRSLMNRIPIPMDKVGYRTGTYSRLSGLLTSCVERHHALSGSGSGSVPEIDTPMADAPEDGEGVSGSPAEDEAYQEPETRAQDLQLQLESSSEIIRPNSPVPVIRLNTDDDDDVWAEKDERQTETMNNVIRRYDEARGISTAVAETHKNLHHFLHLERDVNDRKKPHAANRFLISIEKIFPDVKKFINLSRITMGLTS